MLVGVAHVVAGAADERVESGERHAALARRPQLLGALDNFCSSALQPGCAPGSEVSCFAFARRESAWNLWEIERNGRAIARGLTHRPWASAP